MTTATVKKIGFAKSYPKLVEVYPPRIIRDDREHRRALAVIDQLMRIERPSASQLEYLELLSTLVEQYESIAHPTPQPSLHSLLGHLIEAKGTTQAAVSRATGIQKSFISEVMHGRRKLSIDTIKKLAAYFSVEPSLFLECAS